MKKLGSFKWVALSTFSVGMCVTAYCFLFYQLVKLQACRPELCEWMGLLFLCAFVFALLLCNVFFAARAYRKFWEREENQQGEAK